MTLLLVEISSCRLDWRKTYWLTGLWLEEADHQNRWIHRMVWLVLRFKAIVMDNVTRVLGDCDMVYVQSTYKSRSLIPLILKFGGLQTSCVLNQSKPAARWTAAPWPCLHRYLLLPTVAFSSSIRSKHGVIVEIGFFSNLVYEVVSVDAIKCRCGGKAKDHVGLCWKIGSESWVNVTASGEAVQPVMREANCSYVKRSTESG